MPFDLLGRPLALRGVAAPSSSVKPFSGTIVVVVLSRVVNDLRDGEELLSPRLYACATPFVSASTVTINLCGED